jgi:hypothetical protein
MTGDLASWREPESPTTRRAVGLGFSALCKVKFSSAATNKIKKLPFQQGAFSDFLRIH